jgi:hypothetical protein
MVYAKKTLRIFKSIYIMFRKVFVFKNKNVIKFILFLL